MNYAEMSDDKINLQVFECLFGNIGEDRDMLRIWQQGKFQPCNSWADAGPIMLANKIGISPYVELWEATQGRLDIDCPNFVSDNPLRAAMVVFLMMQEGKCSN